VAVRVALRETGGDESTITWTRKVAMRPGAAANEDALDLPPGETGRYASREAVAPRGTPLDTKLAQLGRALLVIVLALCAVIALTGSASAGWSGGLWAAQEPCERSTRCGGDSTERLSCWAASGRRL
jgi:hypothetical protein